MSAARRLSLCLAIASLSPVSLLAQDLRRVQPEPVPPRPAAPQAATPAGPAASVPADRVGATLPPGPAAAAGTLRGLVLMLDASQLSGQAPDTPGLDLRQAGDLPRLDLLQAQLQPLIGQPLSNELLASIRQAVDRYFAATGTSFSRVSIPAQDVTHGVVQAVIIRGRVGKIASEGGHYFTPDSYTRAMMLAPGEPVNESDLQRGANWINLNPFRHASIGASPGSQLGDVDLLVRATDELPLRVYAAYDDQGQKVTGEHQILAGVNWGNVTGIGDQANYQHTSATEPRRMHADSLTYVAPLPWQHLLTVSGSTSHTKPALAAPLNQLGTSSQIGLRYGIPLLAAAGDSQMLSFGVDRKKTNNNIAFAEIPVVGSTSAILQGVLEYTGSAQDPRGVTRWDAKVVASPGDAMANNNDAAFGKQRQGARSTYEYLNVNVQRDTALPAAFAWSAELQGQLASGNLLGSEQIGFGGESANRGFDPGSVYADQGFNLRNELRLPTASPFGAWLPTGMTDQLQALVFWDYGVGTLKSPLAGERARYVLSSVGPGLRYSLGRHLSGSVDYGRQLVRAGVDKGPRSGRIDFSLNATW